MIVNLPLGFVNAAHEASARDGSFPGCGCTCNLLRALEVPERARP